jgi:polysaccharide export outer membrane protein
VYQEPDLSVQGVRVKDNGTIALPLLGDLQVAGLTSQDLRELIVERLLDGYLKQPSVAVSIDGYRLYYIKGEVNRPGGYSFVDGLTVAKAVALAGVPGTSLPSVRVSSRRKPYSHARQESESTASESEVDTCGFR